MRTLGRVLRQLSHYVLTYAPLQPDDRSRAEVLAAARLAGLSSGSRVLDVPCGYGRHAVPLAAEGYHVVGLDRSVAPLDEARRRRGAASGLRLVRADYREIPLATGAFDGALNLHSSLGYAGGDRAVLGEIRRVLRPEAASSSRRTIATGCRRGARYANGIPLETAPSF